jgi:Tol biopolymer transport system component
MTELRRVLERVRDRIPASPGGLERLIRYRERKRRRQQLMTIGMALVLGLAGTLIAVRALTPRRSSPATAVPHSAIAFVRGTTLAGPLIPAEIYLMEPDGSGVRKLTDAAAEGNVAAEPAWSPDGTRIAFVLSTPEHLGAYAGDGDIYIMNADGTEMIKLTNGLRDAHPAWSPDGTRIVFVRDQGNSLLVMNADGGDATEIRPNGEAFPPYQWPAWSPDGTRIAFQASPSEGVDTNGVYVTDIHGNGTKVTPGSTDGYPAWSPDGATLAYAGADGIYLHDMQTGTDRRLTFCGKPENCGFDFEPSWAPDGGRVVFTRQDYGGGSRQIFVVNADGTGFRQLTSGLDWNTEPSWQLTAASDSPSLSASTPTSSPRPSVVSNLTLPDGVSAGGFRLG